MWVIFDKRQVLVMFIFAVVDSFVEDHIPISVFMDFMALSQFMSKQSRLPFRYIPNRRKGSFSHVILVILVISGVS